MFVQTRNRIEELLNPRFFKALCDANRLSILSSIACCREPQSVSQLASCCPIDMSVVSRHLAILRDADIVEATKKGKEVFYSVQVGKVAKMLRDLADALEACCPPEPQRQVEVELPVRDDAAPPGA